MAEPKWIYADEEWIKDLQEKAKEVDYYKGYVKGLEYGYKAKEYDRASDCEGCKFVGVSARCEGCCRNYADGYVAEQTELKHFDKPSKCLGCVYSELAIDFHPCASCVDFSKYIGETSGEQTEPQTDNGIGCSRCEGRFDCYDRDMPHAVHCNNYGKITDEPQTDCPKTCPSIDICTKDATDCAWK